MAIQESETLGLLAHHNIITYIDAFEDNGGLSARRPPPDRIIIGFPFFWKKILVGAN